MTIVTGILSAIERGDERTDDELPPLVYDALRKLGARKLEGERPGRSLQPAALVHEAYIRLVGSEGARLVKDHRHFFAAAAVSMRRILIDRARRKRARQRGASGVVADLEALPRVVQHLGRAPKRTPNDESGTFRTAAKRTRPAEVSDVDRASARVFGGDLVGCQPRDDARAGVTPPCGRRS